MSKIHLKDTEKGLDIELPEVESVMGPSAIDVRQLHKKFGHFSFDPGFISTASCKSKITFIDGDEGVLLYRGYDIQELAEKSTYTEVAYLLIYGELPTEKQLQDFTASLNREAMIHESLKNFYTGFHHDAHPMAVMVGVVGSLSAFYHDGFDPTNPESRSITAHRLLAKMPTIAAGCYRHSIDQPFMYPKSHLSYAGNFLNMMFSVPTEDYEINPVAEKALDLLFILHADHEQNASTSTVRMAGSSGANAFACMAAGIASLWGPAHGGANEAVLRMLHQIGDTKNIPAFIDKAKDKNDSFRLMGFGHRVYKNYDPRAKIIRDMCYKLLRSLNAENDPLFELALELENYAMQDDYFIERKLYPNVDFYSGLMYKALGIPTDMFTVMFALPRTSGWIAHWSEMMAEPDHRINRPRQVYNGHAIRAYMPIEKRAAYVAESE